MDQQHQRYNFTYLPAKTLSKLEAGVKNKTIMRIDACAILKAIIITAIDQS